MTLLICNIASNNQSKAWDRLLNKQNKRVFVYIWIQNYRNDYSTITKITLGRHWAVTLTSNHLNNIIIRFPLPKIPHTSGIIHDSMPFWFFSLQLISKPDGGHIGFRQYGGPSGHSSWRPSKIEKVWIGQHACQIWCFWKNLNQKSLTVPTRSWISCFTYGFTKVVD